MIDIPLLPSAANPVPAVSAPLPVNRIVGTLTPAVLNLPVGTLLTGTITQRDANGNITISTSKGPLTLNTPLALTMGSELGFKVLSEAPGLQVQLSTVNGTPITRESVTSLLGHAEGKVPLQLTASSHDPTIFRARHVDNVPTSETPLKAQAIETTIHAPYAGSFIKGSFVTAQPKALDAVLAQAVQAGVIDDSGAIIAGQLSVTAADADELALVPRDNLASSSPVASAKAQSQQLTPGSTAIFRIVAGSVPFHTANAPATAPPLPGALAMQSGSPLQVATPFDPPATPELLLSAFPDAFSPSPAAMAARTSPLLQQAAAEEIANGGQPTGASVPIAPETEGGAPVSPTALQIKGTVIGREITGETLLKTPLGIIRLPTDTALPKGTELVLELVTLTPLAQQTSLSSRPLSRHDAIVQLFANWTSLGDTLDTMQEQAPQLAGKMLHSLIPNTENDQFTAKLMHFIDSVKGEGIEQWMGAPVLEKLKEAGKRETVNKLTHEFAALKNLYNEPSQVNNWQTLIFPLYDGEELHQVHMFVRDHPPSSEEEAATMGKDTRFLIEVNTDRLGDLQFDGLVHSDPLQKTFDLIIRTQYPLPNEMRADISAMFMSASEITGMKGGLTFQSTPDFPIKPIEDVIADNHESIIV